MLLSHSSRVAATPRQAIACQQHGARRLAVSNRRARQSLTCKAAQGGSDSATTAPSQHLDGTDLRHLIRAAQVSQDSIGQTQPHPNAGCVLVCAQGVPVAEASQWAQGTEAPECQAARMAGGAARGGTAYLNLECGDCHGENAGVEALVAAGVVRVVVGLRHPLPHLRAAAIQRLRGAGVQVAVLGEVPCSATTEEAEAAMDACLAANEALLHRAVTKRPMGLLKYAMTLDGKIATHTGHSAWVSSPQSRQQVFEMRARSDAVIVGGCTVRRDNPRLTTRREGGHQPMRIVMSRTLDLPDDANLWDVDHAPTIVATQRGARLDFQRMLRSRGVEVLEFDFLTPDAVARYCYDRGFLQCLWECGGMLAAPAIAGGAIHKTMAFVAPKLIGGNRAPTPVGDLGFVEMTQALPLAEVSWRQVGPDLMLTGYLPQSGGLRALAAAAAAADGATGMAAGQDGLAAAAAAAGPSDGAVGGAAPGAASAVAAARRHPGARLAVAGQVAEFYKAWDRYGCLSNFSPHAIDMPEGPMTPDRLQQQQQPSAAAEGVGSGGTPGSSSSSAGGGASGAASLQHWPSTEHYYQAQKFVGVTHADAEALVAAIAAAGSPEEAARLGRRAQRRRPELMRGDWEGAKVAVMLAALRAKFAAHAGPRHLLLATARNCGGRGCDASSSMAAAAASSSQDGSGSSGGSGWGTGLELVESSPHDFFWGRGYDGSGHNMLGKLLMQVRQELLQQAQQERQAQQAQQQAGLPPEAQQQQQQAQQAGQLDGGSAAAPERRPAGV